ncbi:MAG: hypothetical protein M1G31_23140 [Pseudanabaena sp. Salubria-1]|nr:hypothetical protein [Pseudanabaena sp. Salubria-1]
MQQNQITLWSSIAISPFCTKGFSAPDEFCRFVAAFRNTLLIYDRACHVNLRD